jgi:asparagine synthase (glutamine-hydrolysing)
MCGIAGWCGRNFEGDAGVGQMVQRIRHRGPDDFGLWFSPDRGCILGHARLSIIDLSPAGHQPMIDKVTGNCIVYNGEIYNFQYLREKLQIQGEHFYSRTDTEVILTLYRLHGEKCLQYLRGMFAFAIWDIQRQRLFLARDRLGKKPLNYTIGPQGLGFCSEIDPLAHHPGISRDIDEEALELYLQLQYIPAPWTIYRSIRKLPPAHFAFFDRKGFFMQQYWNVNYRSKIRISEQDALDGLEEKLKEAISLRMISDVPLGALLSGGVDSSLVVALMAGISGEPVKTFSVGFRENTFNELSYANAVAKRYQTDHHPVIMSGEVESLLTRIMRHYGEPFADSSAIPSFLVCQTARNHVTVALNGDGGDELLGGYGRYWLPRINIMTGRVCGTWYSAERLARLAPSLVIAHSLLAKVRRKWFVQFAHPEIHSIMYSAFWNDQERARLVHCSEGDGSPVLFFWRTEYLDQMRHFADNPIDRMLWIDNHTYLPGDLLVKMDIASMHCALEVRSPLLDHEVIEFCASLPVRLKVHQRTGKYLLKKLGERYLPHDLLYRPKMGFGIPKADWLRDFLKPVVQEVLNNSVLMEPLNNKVIHQTMTEFFEQGREHSSRIWTLLMFGLWRQHLKNFSNYTAS